MSKLPPALQQQMNSVDYTQFLPIGRVAKYGNYGIKAARVALDPKSIQAGVRAFEAEAMAYRQQQAEMARQARAMARKLAFQAKQKADFQKLWPQGASEALLGNYIKQKPLFNPWKLK